MKQHQSAIQNEINISQMQLELLYQQHAAKILKYVSRQVSSEQDAEDILIDAFVAALESEVFAALTAHEQQAWLWRVARNKVVDKYRRANVAQLANIDDGIEEDPWNGPEQQSIRQEEDEHLALLLKDLSPLQQQVLYLRFGEDLRCAQIAAIVGKREGSIRSLLSRTFNLLRRTYHAQAEGGDHHETKR